jgi:[ribosomal protein S5]-alanine N-acetyltransferase
MIPAIKTKRLVLNAFNLTDAKAIGKLMKNKKIFDTTVKLPFPYKLIDAQKWIAEHMSLFLKSREGLLLQ